MSDERRKAMEAAFDKSDAEERGETYVPPVAEVDEESTIEAEGSEEDPGEVEQRAADTERTRPDPRAKRDPVQGAKSDGAKPAEGAAPKEGQAPESTPQEKAPQSWKPEERQFWDKVPKEARAAIVRREQEMQRGFAQAAGARQVANEYVDLVRPFERTIASLGSTPRDAIHSVMTTATALIVGSQQDKAAVLAEMFDRYQVDLAYLDKYLTARAKGEQIPGHQGRAPVAPVQAIDPRMMQMLQPLFELQNRITKADQESTERTNQRAAEAITQLQDAPYFEDIREDMADILEFAAKRNQTLTLKQAYDRAIQLRPDIQKLIPRAAPVNNGNSMARRRRASSSVKGAPGSAAVGGNKSADSRRSAIEEAWDSVS